LVSFDGKTTVKSCAAKEFALYNKVADSYHAEYITCIHRMARFHVPRRENINTLDVSGYKHRVRALPTFLTDLHVNRAIKAFVTITFTFFVRH